MALLDRISVRRRAPHAVQIPPPREGLRASAQRVDLTNKKVVRKTSVGAREWQNEAWEYFDDVPEIKYSMWYLGNVLSKLRIFAAVRDPADPDAEPIPASDPEASLPAGAAARAQLEIDRLRSRLGGRPEITRALNMNLEVAGDGSLIGFGPREVTEKDPLTGQDITILEPEDWGIYSVSQISQKDGEIYVQLKPGDEKSKRKLDPVLDCYVRIFQRHPRWSLEADCNMRGVLGPCEQLTLLGNSISADAKSRMSAGWLLIANELSSPDSDTEPEGEEESAVDPLMQEIYNAAVEPIEDPAAASAVAPVMVRGPAEFIDKGFKLVERQRVADPQVLEKMTAAIERIARGLNLPVEVVMGHQQTTFANALQVSKDTFSDHFEPRCVMICDALTVGFLQPNLIAAGMAPDLAERIVVWFDPSQMIAQPEPVDSADQGVAIGALALEAWRRAKGWTEDDAPDPTEQLVQAVMKLGMFDPQITAAILELLGVPLDIEAAPASSDPAGFAQAAGIQPLLARALAAKFGGQGGPETLQSLLLEVLHAKPGIAPALAASAEAAQLPLEAGRATRNIGWRLMLIDRSLRERLLVAADRAMTRALERAGNRLRSKAGQARELARAGFTHSIYFASNLGRALVASAGFEDDDLLGADSWDGLEASFRAWVAGAQAQALKLAGARVELSAAQRTLAQQQQADDLERAWAWLAGELDALARVRLYAPDPAEPLSGEFDPSLRIPPGLIRQALARAGGASGIEPVQPSKPVLAAAFPGSDAAGTPVYVAVNDGIPLGGVAAGELVQSLLLEDGTLGVEGYEWVYGPAYRVHPFEEHEALDSAVFQTFEDDVLVAGDWVGEYYFPGDHDGCNCDIAPTIVEAAALEDSASDAGLTELGDAPQ